VSRPPEEPDARAPSRPSRRDLPEDCYPGAAGDLFNALLAVLDRARSSCGGDSDGFLVLLVILARTAQHPEFKTRRQRDMLGDEIGVFPSLGTNVRSIAASIGVPRESVRRKVLELIALAWVVRRGRNLLITNQGYRQLAPVHDGLGRLAFRYFEIVSACLHRGASPPP
jgi:hypothetical protein